MAPLETSALLGWTAKDLMQASATIYECGILCGTRLGGTQRKRHMAACASLWTKNIAGVEYDDKLPASWVHPALLSAAK